MTLKEAKARDKILRNLIDNRIDYRHLDFITHSPYHDRIFHILLEEKLVENNGQAAYTTDKGKIVIENGGFVMEQLMRLIQFFCSVVAAAASVFALLLQFRR